MTLREVQVFYLLFSLSYDFKAKYQELSSISFSAILYSNYPISSINHPKNRGQKTVFFCSFFAPKSPSNHYMLWLTSTFCPSNHNRSSELYSQRGCLRPDNMSNPLLYQLLPIDLITDIITTHFK